MGRGNAELARYYLQERLGWDERGHELWHVWSQERVVLALQRFARQHGRVPNTMDARSPRIKHGQGTMLNGSYQPGTLPSLKRVLQLFGSWRVAVEAAGLEPRPLHPPHKRCRRGHLLTPANTIPASRSTGRRCRTCTNANARHSYRRRRGPR